MTISPPLIASDILEVIVAAREITRQSPCLHTASLGMSLDQSFIWTSRALPDEQRKQLTNHGNVVQSTHTAPVIGDSETQMLPKLAGRSG